MMIIDLSSKQSYISNMISFNIEYIMQDLFLKQFSLEQIIMLCYVTFDLF